MKISNTWYDRLKYIQMIVLPALAGTILALNAYWDIPNQDRIVGTIAVVGTFLGALLRQSSKNFQGAGDLIVAEDATDGEVYTAAQFAIHPKHLKDGQNIVLNVKRVDGTEVHGQVLAD